MRYWIFLLCWPAWAQQPCLQLMKLDMEAAQTTDSLAAMQLLQKAWECGSQAEALDTAQWKAYVYATSRLGAMNLQRGNSELALQYFESVKDKPGYDTLNAPFATLLNDKGIALQEAKRYEESEQSLWRSIYVKQSLYGGEWDLSIARTFTNLGNLYTEMKAFEKAEYVLMRAGGIVMRLRGEKDLDIVPIHLNVANAMMMQDKNEEAGSTYATALRALHGYKPTPYVLTLIMRSARGLAQSHINRDQPKKAIRVLGILIEDLDSLQGVPQYELMQVYLLLGNAFETDKLYEEAADSYMHTLTLLTALGMQSASMHYNIGRMELLILEYDKAEQHFQQALALTDKLELKRLCWESLKMLYEASDNVKGIKKANKQLEKLNAN